MEHGEQPAEGIKREIREETGLELKNLRLFRVRTLGRHLELLYSAEAVGTPRVLSREITELAWFSSGRMPEKMNASQKGLIEQVLKGEV